MLLATIHEVLHPLEQVRKVMIDRGVYDVNQFGLFTFLCNPQRFLLFLLAVLVFL
jgi:hypothetical protein